MPYDAGEAVPVLATAQTIRFHGRASPALRLRVRIRAIVRAFRGGTRQQLRNNRTMTESRVRAGTVGDTTTAERVLEELAKGCPTPPENQIRTAYQSVGVHDRAGWPWPGTIVGWWTSPDGVTTCQVRLSGASAPRWAVYDPDRIILLVQSGT